MMPLRHLGVKARPSIFSKQVSTHFRNASSSATLTAPVTTRDQGLQVLAAMTAPTPQPPAALKRPPMTQAALTQVLPGRADGGISMWSSSSSR